MDQYKKAQTNMDYNVSIPYSRTLIALSNDIHIYKDSILEAIKISQAEINNNRHVSICCKTEEEQQALFELLKSYSSMLEYSKKTPLQLDRIHFVVTDNPGLECR